MLCFQTSFPPSADLVLARSSLSSAVTLRQETQEQRQQLEATLSATAKRAEEAGELACHVVEQEAAAFPDLRAKKDFYLRATRIVFERASDGKGK